jgi:23S rRNA pseudouridine2605 synthase
VGKPTPDVLARLKQGIHLAEALAHVQHVTVKRSREKKSVLEIVLNEGRNREIRRMLARVGHKVVQLKRVAIGRIRLGDLPLGAVRPLTHAEVRSLKQDVKRLPSPSVHRGKMSPRASRGKRKPPTRAGRGIRRR